VVAVIARNRIREWPRLLVAAVALAVLLVFIGVVVASASTGGGKSQQATINHLRLADGTQATRLAADAKQISTLKSQLAAAASARVVAATTAEKARLRGERRVANCWRAKALHPKTNVGACLRRR
jgi:hypothetical protein